MRIDRDLWRARRVLVTGHTGFKGAWLSLWLQSLGAEVVGLSPGSPTQPSLYRLARVGEGMAQEHAADVRDGEAVRPWQHVLNALGGYLEDALALTVRWHRRHADGADMRAVSLEQVALAA